MDLKERTYSVLVVSAAEKFNAALSPLLTPAVCSTVRTVDSVSAAKRAVAERAFDFVILNAPLPDDMGLRFAIDAAAGDTVVLVLVREAVFPEVADHLTANGVFALSKPTGRQIMTIALHWMASARERLRKTEKQALSLQDKMEEIRLVNRAKWLLIEKEGMDEPTAHRYLEKQAMDRCITRRELAKEIIQNYT